MRLSLKQAQSFNAKPKPRPEDTAWAGRISALESAAAALSAAAKDIRAGMEVEHPESPEVDLSPLVARLDRLAGLEDMIRAIPKTDLTGLAARLDRVETAISSIGAGMAKVATPRPSYTLDIERNASGTISRVKATPVGRG